MSSFYTFCLLCAFCSVWFEQEHCLWGPLFLTAGAGHLPPDKRALCLERRPSFSPVSGCSLETPPAEDLGCGCGGVVLCGFAVDRKARWKMRVRLNTVLVLFVLWF